MGVPAKSKPTDLVSAESLQKLLRSRQASLKGVIQILNPKPIPRPWNLYSWRRSIEKQYNHLEGYYTQTDGKVTTWVSAGLKNKRGLIADSPLRRDLKTAFGDLAAGLIRDLEIATPTKSMSDGEVAATILNSLQRQQGITIAEGLKRAQRWPSAWAPCDILAKWLFNDKVWPALCKNRADQISYYKFGQIGGDDSVPLFRKPMDDEKKNWGQDGAEKYLRGIAANIDKQLLWFSEDIGWLQNLMGLRLAGAIERLAGVKVQIRKYQKAWEDLGTTTGTLPVIKGQILNPAGGKATYIKYLWSEEERKKLPAWRAAKME